jgi:hypothetical protein
VADRHPPEGRPPERLLVVGVERSGTTWVAKAIAATMGATYVHEPDSPGASPGANHAREFGRYPVVRVGDKVPLYEEDWDLAFRGGFLAPKATAPIGRALNKVPVGVRQPLVGVATRLVRARPSRQLVVTKSVMCPFSLDWIIDRYSPPVVWVRRNPLNIVASLIEVGASYEGMQRLYTRYGDPVLQATLIEPLGLPVPPADLDLVDQCAYWVGLNSAAYQQSADLHGDFVIVEHDTLCLAPAEGFARLCAQLGVGWSEAGEAFVRKSNKEGEGFTTNRITALEPERWRRMLADREAELRAILGRFPGAF